ncbi:MAG: hypothetical protein L0K86_26140 [Actinomycetia bacterium]|nr:hypothetical protein [Actinomycetes bacterium]
MSPTDGEPRDPHVLAVARVLDRTGRRVTALEDNVRRLGADLARLTGAVAARPAPSTPEAHPEPVTMPPVASWLLAAGTDSEQLPAAIMDLIGWLDLVYLRFPDALLTGCWLWHPWVVEELWWLRGAHADAYDPQTGSWLRVGDWHDRQRPGVARRVRDVLGKCDLSLHVGDRAELRPGIEAPQAPFARDAASLAGEWGRSGTSPAPTEDQLDEDRAQAATQIRRRR